MLQLHRRRGVARGVGRGDSGVAFFAHIGGFVFGALIALPFRLRDRRRSARAGAVASRRRHAGPAAEAPRPTAWDNRAMAEETGREIEMVVESVRVHMLSSRHVVILKETGSRTPACLIWIGPWEASAIAMRLQGLTPERPLTHDLFATALDELGVQVERVVIATSPRRRSTPG